MTETSVYETLGVPRVINASGTKTRIGGSRIRTEALAAMQEAATDFVRLSDLQAAASERISALTEAEAGYVTNGASGALTLATAACIAGTDPGTMYRLPDTSGVADEVVMPRTHRTGYDHAIRAAGADIVDIGTNDQHLGTGARNVEAWEYVEAIGTDTVAVAHVYKSDGAPPLGEVCETAHEHDLPVVVDAAAEVPPVDNFSWFTDRGADVVAFSGGKGIRGPQTTGILAGRADLIESVAFQHLDLHAAAEVWEPPVDLVDADGINGVPRQGIGRALKVGKEELVGLLAALDAFVDEDHEATRRAWQRRSEQVASRLAAAEGLSATVDGGARSVAPVVVADVDPTVVGRTATDIVRELRRENPRVFVGADDLDAGEFSINPMCLTDEEADYTVQRVFARVEGSDD